MLEALLTPPSVRPLLTRLGLPDAAPAAELDDIRAGRRRGGLSRADAAALDGLGIDLDAMLSRVEAELGPGAARRHPATDPGEAGRGPAFPGVVLRPCRRPHGRQMPGVTVEHCMPNNGPLPRQEVGLGHPSPPLDDCPGAQQVQEPSLSALRTPSAVPAELHQKRVDLSVEGQLQPAD